MKFYPLSLVTMKAEPPLPPFMHSAVISSRGANVLGLDDAGGGGIVADGDGGMF